MEQPIRPMPRRLPPRLLLRPPESNLGHLCLELWVFAGTAFRSRKAGMPEDLAQQLGWQMAWARSKQDSQDSKKQLTGWANRLIKRDWQFCHLGGGSERHSIERSDQHVTSASQLRNCLLHLVPRGLEPRTLRLLAVRSNQLSYETTDVVHATPIRAHVSPIGLSKQRGELRRRI